jgi:hypothetical protein
MVSSRNILAVIVWGGKYNNNNNQPTKAIDLTYLAHLDSKWIFPKAAVYRERHWKSTQRNSELCAGWHLLQSSLFQIRLLHSKRRPEIYRQDSGCDTFLFVCETEKGGKKKNFFLLTSQSPSNSGGPISRQSCYYASFSPPHEDLESWWLTRRVGEKAFCSSRYVERDALLFHPHRKKKKKVFRCVCVCARGCWSLRGFFWLAATRQCIYIQLIPPLFSMTKYNIPKHAKVMKYIQTRLHHLLIEIHHF